jgi:PAS domain-containing protein
MTKPINIWLQLSIQPNTDGLFRRITPLCFVLLLLFCSACFAESPKEPRRVLVLYSEDKTHPGHELTYEGIRAGFRSNRLFDVQLFNEYLDLSRFRGTRHDSATVDYLRRKYAGIKIDAIITIYPAAINFLMRGEGKLFPGVPILACEITRVDAENLKRSPSRYLITGVVLGDNIAGVLDSAFRMKPGTRHVALVAGTSRSDLHSESIFRKGLEPYAKRIDLIDLTRLPMQETLSRVGSLPLDTIVLYSSMFADGTGQSFVPREALKLISQAANAPVFGLYESFLGYGIVGGRLVSFEQQGREAATLALRIMGGESPASIPFGGEQAYTNLYDWRELKRWGIQEKDLPPGSRVLFRKFSLWESYKWYLIVFIAFSLCESFLVLVLVLTLRDRRTAERRLADSETRYRTVANYTHDWEYWSDPHGKLLYVSPSCERITGYGPHYFTEDPARLREIILPED